MIKIKQLTFGNLWFRSSKTNLINNTDNLDNINFIKGEVEKTSDLEKNLPSKISILRLDTDWYESTKRIGSPI